MTSPAASPVISIAVFAYNEERSIAAALDAIGACAGEGRVTTHVLINGCSDGTEAVVRAYRPQGFDVVPVVIRRGDKANAWNVYVHEVAPEAADFHVFTDGDMIIQPGSLAGFAERFAAEPEADGCAGLPVSGRSREAFRGKLLHNREMAGNLYALRSRCVMAFRRAGLRLPFGIFGEDGLVTMLVRHGLDPKGERRDGRVAVSEQGGFAFPPLSPWRPSDWRIYRNRKRRYAVRRQQAMMLYPLLFEQGAKAMPAHVLDLYRGHFGATRLTWRGLETIFDWEARRRIARDLARAEEARGEDQAHLYS
jgi:glycosyltransferase involved in cell wall biosynthesis